MALTNHILPDSPTNNFATLNPLNLRGATLYDGSLKISGGGNNTGSFATIPIQKTDKWYIEVRTNDTTTDTALFLKPSKYFSLSTQDEEETIAIFSYSTDISIRERTSPTSYTELGVVTGQSRTTTGDVLGYLFDLENNTITVYKNGVHKLTVTNVTPVDDVYFVGYNVDSTWGAVNMTFNFGQDPTFAGAESPTTTYTDANGIGAFYYQPPTDALALCTANLPDFTPTVAGDTPQDYFKAVLYTGNGSTQSITGVGFQPDFVWSKPRSAGFNIVRDSVRGSTYRLITDGTYAELSDSNYGTFSSDGFNLGAENNINANTVNYIAWCFRAGGPPTADNTATSGAMTANSVSLNGTLQSNYTPAGSPTIYPTRMSINTDAGFSIVKYTGNGTTGAKIPHGLNSAPDMIIIKNLGTTFQWETQHIDIDLAGAGIHLNNNTEYNSSASDRWDSQRANSTVVTVSNNGAVNEVNKGFIMYCWHSVEGYSKFGSYTGNGSADGPFVYTGFRPAFVIRKAVNLSYGWYLDDSARNPENMINDFIRADVDSAEVLNDTNYGIDLLSNGFKVRSSHITQNELDETYIYMAFAEQPFKFSNAR